MAFPDVPRVIYQKTPSEEVICQVRFPAILKIETEPPSAFQDRIRGDYPFYKSRSSAKLLEGIPAEFVGMLGQLGGETAHNFTSRDEKWMVSLTRDFLALTCHPYDRWENFLAHLHGPLAALQDVYAPALYTRIGLRYRDVIRRSALGLDNAGWADLLQPWVASAYGSPEVAGAVEHVANQLLVRLPDGSGQVRVRYGTNLDEATQETCYVIDADFFSEQQTELSHAQDRLDYFNKQAHRLFRWCIREPLHTAMVPTPVGDA